MPIADIQEPEKTAEAADKPSPKERLKQIVGSIEKGISELFESDRYRQYLSVMSRFHHYSVNNQMLIYMQMPEATHVAGYNKWHDKFERNVRKGQKGITIIAPAPYKKTVEQEKLDPKTKQPLKDANGDPILETREITVPMFRPVIVFDVSQTVGKPLPELAAQLHGDVKNYDVFMEALKRSTSVPVTVESLPGYMDGFFDPSNHTIHIREGMSEVQTVCAALHEMAHSRLHDYGKNDTNDPDELIKTKRTEEIEAESVAFTVCSYYGIDTGDNSFGYLAGWSKDRELTDLKASLETINKTSSELIDDIDRNYALIMKERAAMLDGEKLFSVDDRYLYIQRCSNAIDYTFYDTVTKKEIDGGQFDPSEKSPEELAEELCKANGLGNAGPLKPVDLKVMDCLRTAAERDLIGRVAEARFLEDEDDAVLIYQLNNAAPKELAYATFDHLKESPDPKHYDAVYTMPIDDDRSIGAVLESVFEKFNVDIPKDFQGHSLSVSDIVAIKRSGVISYHYCDAIGFRALESFKPENHLKNAEMSLEDDYDMIDGTINNGRRNEAAQEKKPSILEKIKNPAPRHDSHEKQEKKTARSKSAGMEI